MYKKNYKFLLHSVSTLSMILLVACSSSSKFPYESSFTANKDKVSSVTMNDTLNSDSDGYKEVIPQVPNRVLESVIQKNNVLYGAIVDNTQNEDHQPVSSYDEIVRNTPTPEGLRLYLKETLTPDQYTYLYYTHGGGLGVATNDRKAVEDAVLAYVHPEVAIEYKDTPFSRKILEEAKAELEQFKIHQDQLGDPLIVRICYNVTKDGYIHIFTPKVHPALEDFLKTNPYAYCMHVRALNEECVISPMD